MLFAFCHCGAEGAAWPGGAPRVCSKTKGEKGGIVVSFGSSFACAGESGCRDVCASLKLKWPTATGCAVKNRKDKQRERNEESMK